MNTISEWLKKEGYTFWWSRAKIETILPQFIKDGNPVTLDEVVKRYLASQSLSNPSSPGSESVEVALKYEKVFEFETFQNWVNTAKRKFSQFQRWEGDERERIVCIDINGNCLTLGEDFMIAEKENLFPVTAYRFIRTSEVKKTTIPKP